MKKILLLLAFLLLPNFAHAGSTPPNCAADGIHGLTYSSATNAFACTVISLFNSILPLENGGTGSTNSSDALKVFSGVLNASSCANVSFHPTWCSGSDVGAWINSAIAYATAQSYYNYKIILDPTQTYAQTTTIAKPINLALDCQGSKLSRSATSGAAILLGSYAATSGDYSSAQGNQGGLWNCKFYGAGGSVSAHSDIGIYSGTDPLGVLTGSNIYDGGDFTFNVEITGFNKAYTYGSNTYQFTHYNGMFHNNYDGIVNSTGTTNTGELMQLVGTKVFNNSHCGFNLANLNDWWTMVGGTLDYNGTAACGNQPNLELINVHIEQSNGPIIASSSLNQIRGIGGTWALTSGSTAIGEDGWMELTGSDAANSVSLSDVQFYANHTVPYITYTGGLSTPSKQCYRNNNWLYSTAHQSDFSDAFNYCTDNVQTTIYQTQNQDLNISYINDQSGKGVFVSSTANSRYSAYDFKSDTAPSQWWRTGMNGSSSYRITDVTNASTVPFTIQAGSPADSIRVLTTGVGILNSNPTVALDVTGTIRASGQFSGPATGLTGTAASLTAGNVTTNANLTGAVTSVGNATSLGSFSSAQLASALTDETGTAFAVFSDAPTFTGNVLFNKPVSGSGDLNITINNSVVGNGAYQIIQAQSKFLATDYKSASATAQWWRVGMDGNSSFRITDVTNTSAVPFTIAATAPTNSLRVTTTGVGILTTTPSAELDVTGAIKASTSITASRIIAGGTKFTASGCSNSTTVGGAFAGKFTSGTTGTCTVALTMNGATGATAPNGWHCTCSDNNTPAVACNTKSTTTTAPTIEVVTTSGDIVSFACTGY